MSILIKGMEMPSTGLYFISVDNTGGRDKTIATVERMLGNRDVRHIIGSFELVPVPPHGRLIDADALKNIVFESLKNAIIDCNPTLFGKALCTFIAESIVDEIEAAPTIILAERVNDV